MSEHADDVVLAVPGDEVAATARAWAAEIAADAPRAVQAMKRLFRHGLTEVPEPRPPRAPADHAAVPERRLPRGHHLVPGRSRPDVRQTMKDTP